MRPAASGDEVAVVVGDLDAEAAKALRWRSTGRGPKAQPPGIEMRASPARPSSAPITTKLARILLTSR
jgi:hypothetical protein